MNAFLLAFALLGHMVLWTAVVNRLHSIGLPRRVVILATGGIFLAAAVAAVAISVWLVVRRTDFLGAPGGLLAIRPLAAYLVVCWLSAAWGIAGWLRRHALWASPDVIRSHRSRLVAPLSGVEITVPEDHDHHFLARLPGNQVLWLDVAERALEVPLLPKALDGTTVVHLSDLHFTGRIGKGYFLEVVRQSNQLAPDLVAVTGDLVDAAQCLSWIPETLGKLESRFGVYFVLGNHDRRVGPDRLRSILRDAGLIDLGGRWIEVAVRGERVILAGNELPWLCPAADLASAPPRHPAGPLRIALAHSPDQLRWARRHEVDLLLAGHTHGGQIRLPWIGPILTPSNRGVHYSSGTFHAPPTIMHVSRGISGEVPVRMNCLPEMACLTLHAPVRI